MIIIIIILTILIYDSNSDNNIIINNGVKILLTVFHQNILFILSVLYIQKYFIYCIILYLKILFSSFSSSRKKNSFLIVLLSQFLNCNIYHYLFFSTSSFYLRFSFVLSSFIALDCIFTFHELRAFREYFLLSILFGYCSYHLFHRDFVRASYVFDYAFISGSQLILLYFLRIL